MVLLVIIGLIIRFDGSISNMFEFASSIIPPAIASKNPQAVLAAAGVDSNTAINAVRAIIGPVPNAMTIGVQTPTVFAQISTVIALVFGTAGLPHILIMFYTVPSAKAAKKAVMACIFALGIFYLASIFLGFLTMAMVYPDMMKWMGAGKAGLALNMAVVKISDMIGGRFMMAIATSGAFAAILSTTAGLMITAASTISHDLYKNYINPKATEKQELSIAKITTVVMSAIAIILAIVLKKENVAWLITLAFGIAASAIFPMMMGTLWFKRFTRQAAIAGMITGLVVSAFCVILLLAGRTELFGLALTGGPGLFGIPLSIAAVIIVSALTKDTGANVEEFFALAHKEEPEV
jgi:cation/acetate symporter